MGYTPDPPPSVADPDYIATWTRHHLTGDAASAFPSTPQLSLYIESVTREYFKRYPELRTLTDDDDIALLGQAFGAIVAARFVVGPLGAKLKGNQGSYEVKIAGITRKISNPTPEQKSTMLEGVGDEALFLISIFNVRTESPDLFGAVRPASVWPF